MARTPRLLVLDPVRPEALAELGRDLEVVVRLKPPQDELAALVKEVDPDAVVVRSGVRLTGEVIRSAPRLRVIGRAGSGTDNIDVAVARELGIRVFTLHGVSANAVAELALGLALSVTRNLALADRQIRAGLWRKPELAGPELGGHTLGVVGLGPIGSRLAELARPLRMRVLASVASPTPQRTEELAAEDIELVPLERLLRESHVVCLALPLNDATRHLISGPELAAMGPDAYLVNVARGGVVDEQALYEALSAGVIAGAALDVHAVEGGVSPLAELDNVVLTPHIGATTHDAQHRIGTLLVSRLREELSAAGVLARPLTSEAVK
ncbi:NAD(P)-dependent oxidoreductase [Streptomyces niveiscabiei]|uniref:NAD(P)-dependent oxidoreductase n=1 Tax=Streptomyces niveiscabiei TaxID=164115 RepID=A0ABW9HLS8_9ACTN